MLTEAITGFNKRRLGGEKIRTLEIEGGSITGHNVLVCDAMQCKQQQQKCKVFC